MKDHYKTKERLLEGHSEIRAARQLYVALGILCLVIASTVMYSLSVGARVETVYLPQVDASMETQVEATLAHLWLEEILAGDRQEDITGVWEHLDRSEWWARTMLQGGQTDEGTLTALRDPELRSAVQQLLEHIARFREIAYERIARGSSDAGIGSSLDQQFDAVFEDFLAHAAEVERHLQRAMRAELGRFKITQGVLIGACLGSALLVAVLLRRLRRREARSLRAAIESEERLGLSLEAGQIASWAWDVRSDSITGDHRWEQIFGRGPGVMKTADDLLAALHPDDRGRLARSMDHAVAGGNRLDTEYRVLQPDGTVRDVKAMGIVMRDDAGEATVMHGMCMDVTERTRAEEQVLRQVQELERFNRLAVGREHRMIELKQRINELLDAAEEPPAYDLAFAKGQYGLAFAKSQNEGRRDEGSATPGEA